jgi:hypothetical protein
LWHIVSEPYPHRQTQSFTVWLSGRSGTLQNDFSENILKGQIAIEIEIRKDDEQIEIYEGRIILLVQKRYYKMAMISTVRPGGLLAQFLTRQKSTNLF